MQELKKVLIVDDELMVRVGLAATIQWEEYGFQVIGSCENGEQAIQEIDRLLPDLVFTDLKMPVLDGFEVIRYLRQHHPAVKIIVLSCLEEVDAVKTAMKLGADDYILKLSLSTDGLKKLLVQLRESIAQDSKAQIRTFAKPMPDSEKKLQFYRRLLKKEILLEPADLSAHSPGYQNCSCFLACCCAIDDFNTLENSGVTQYAIHNLLLEFFQSFSFFEILTLEENERAILLGFSSEDEERIQNIAPYLHKINTVLKTHMNITLSYGVSVPFFRLEHLPEHYQLAKERLSDRFFSGKESVLLCPPHPQGKKKPSIAALASSLQTMIECQSREGVRDLLHQWMAKIRSESYLYSAQTVKSAAAGVWYFVTGYGAWNGEVPDDTLLDENDYFSSFLNAQSDEELLRIFLEAVDSLIDMVSVNQPVHPEIAALKNYLAQHVEEEISLTEAANRCCLNKTYFCTLFKKEVGETYNEYCERLKMERAKQLLLSDPSKVYEIGLKVGIPNESYFSRRFKKYFGVTPGQMRQRKHTESK